MKIVTFEEISKEEEYKKQKSDIIIDFFEYKVSDQNIANLIKNNIDNQNVTIVGLLFNYSDLEKFTDTNLLKSFLSSQKGINIKYLSFDFARNLSEELLKVFIENCPNLKEIIIKNNYSTKNSASTINNLITNLDKLGAQINNRNSFKLLDENDYSKIKTIKNEGITQIANFDSIIVPLEQKGIIVNPGKLSIELTTEQVIEEQPSAAKAVSSHLDTQQPSKLEETSHYFRSKLIKPTAIGCGIALAATATILCNALLSSFVFFAIAAPAIAAICIIITAVAIGYTVYNSKHENEKLSQLII